MPNREPARLIKLAVAPIFALLGLSLLIAPSAGGLLAPTPVGPLGGVNLTGLYSSMSTANADRSIESAKALHARAIRVEIPWSIVEPSRRGQAEPRALAFTDRLVNRASSAGMKGIPPVCRTPAWASSRH